MRSDNHFSGRQGDVDLSLYRHPVIADLEAAFVTKKPTNPLHFVKSWAMRRLREGEEEDEEAERQKELAPRPMRRRGAVVMAKFEETEHWKRFYLKEQLPKNEECRSRIMLGLRSVPFLQTLEWEDINYLVQLGEVREYYADETFVAKGQTIDRLFVLISGEIKRVGQDGPSVLYAEGTFLFAEALISNHQAGSNYLITSEKAWICGIEAYVIHERLREVNRRKEDYFERILMNVGLFTCLDHEEMYKLVLMIKELPPFKADEVVIQKDQPVSSLFLIARGEFSLCRKNLSGEITALQTFREGQFFDEEWLKAKCHSEVAVIARTEGVLRTCAWS